MTSKRVEGAPEPGREPQRQNGTAARGSRSPADETSPPTEPHPTPREDNQDDGDKDLDVPLPLKVEFLRALRTGDLQRAQRLCRAILIYEPHHPEASAFLPLIRQKLLEEQPDGDDDDDDSGSGEGSSRNSDFLSSPSDEDEAESGEETPAKRPRGSRPHHLSDRGKTACKRLHQ
ncbi:glutamate-rich protein 2-like [Syngnathoides biaculeatus]|uniref:glutamate-rich protein 2-like n=1 Tax=Syngnathoides biaculeatus TaxID=300417 RepID=UPI002ADD7A16|nr:glutamate-rich protein 2-like [Syngnathoides biaculeatus]